MSAVEAARWHALVKDGVLQDTTTKGWGDLEAFAQQSYAMVWYLASTLGTRSSITAEEWVLDAARNASIGLGASPTSLFAVERPVYDNDDDPKRFRPVQEPKMGELPEDYGKIDTWRLQRSNPFPPAASIPREAPDTSWVQTEDVRTKHPEVRCPACRHQETQLSRAKAYAKSAFVLAGLTLAVEVAHIAGMWAR